MQCYILPMGDAEVVQIAESGGQVCHVAVCRGFREPAVYRHRVEQIRPAAQRYDLQSACCIRLAALRSTHLKYSMTMTTEVLVSIIA